MAKKIELKISQEVPAGSAPYVDYVPPSGKTAELKKLSANSPIADNSYVKLEYEGTPIWGLWGGGGRTFDNFSRAGDGLKKFRLTLHNPNAYTTWMFASAEFEEF